MNTSEGSKPPHPQLGQHLRDYIIDVNGTGLLLILGVLGVCGTPVLALFAAAGNSAIAVAIFAVLGVMGAVVGWRGFKQYRIYKQYPAVAIHEDGILIGTVAAQLPLLWSEIDRELVRIRAGQQLMFTTTDGRTFTTPPTMQTRRLMIDIDAQIHRQLALKAYRQNPEGVLLEMELLDQDDSLKIYRNRILLPGKRSLDFDAVQSIRQSNGQLLLELNTGDTFTSSDFLVRELAVLETIFVDNIICSRLVPRWLSEIEAGNAIGFVEVRATKDGVEGDDIALTWDELAAAQQADGLDNRRDAIGRQVHADDFVEFSWLLTYMIDREQFDTRIRVFDFVERR